jgi:hypothetical protein
VTAADPVTGVKVSFPDLNHDAGFGGEDFQTNLIMPEPTIFLSKDLPGMFDRPPNSNKAEPRLELLSSSQSKKFFAFLADVAADADEARREGNQ